MQSITVHPDFGNNYQNVYYGKDLKKPTWTYLFDYMKKFPKNEKLVNFIQHNKREENKKMSLREKMNQAIQEKLQEIDEGDEATYRKEKKKKLYQTCQVQEEFSDLKIQMKSYQQFISSIKQESRSNSLGLELSKKPKVVSRRR